MNKLFYLKSTSYPYAYFVKGAGFAASYTSGATKLTQQDIDCARNLGYAGTAVPVVTSFAVNYVRPQDLDATGQVKSNVRNPSRRRFATFAEAFQHGTKLRTRDESKGHLGFYVTETSDAVNARINWETGLTNSI
jgi:hypothetical protein